MAYDVKIISETKKEKILSTLSLNDLYQLKAEIYGTCIKLFTDNYEFKTMWLDNLRPMLEGVRPHGRIFAFHNGKKLEVLYEPNTKTVIIKNCDYYGWLKSIALSLVSEYLEDVPSEHRRYSIHGSCIEYDGKGIGIIGPSGSGKTTLTYGLMLDKKVNFVTDDWFFVKIKENDICTYSSEKNSYLRGGIEKEWPAFKNRLDVHNIDKKGRFIVEVKKLFGDDKVINGSNLKAIVLLTRDKKEVPEKKLSRQDAMNFMVENGFCNPHYLTRNYKKDKIRKAFFSEIFSRVPIYLINTIETPRDSVARIKKICNGI